MAVLNAANRTLVVVVKRARRLMCSGMEGGRLKLLGKSKMDGDPEAAPETTARLFLRG